MLVQNVSQSIFCTKLWPLITKFKDTFKKDFGRWANCLIWGHCPPYESCHGHWSSMTISHYAHNIISPTSKLSFGQTLKYKILHYR